jgi:isopentenyl-diphosphate Delta-isomerase
MTDEIFDVVNERDEVVGRAPRSEVHRTGHLDGGEDYDACAVRELREEIGMAVSDFPARVFKVDACDETGQEFVWLYQCHGEGPFTLHPDEIERGDWFSREHVTRWVNERPGDFAPAFVLLWKQFVARE